MIQPSRSRKELLERQCAASNSLARTPLPNPVSTCATDLTFSKPTPLPDSAPLKHSSQRVPIPKHHHLPLPCSLAWAKLDPASGFIHLFLFYFLNMSCSGPGRNLRTVSRMLSSSSSSSPQPRGIAFFGRVSEPSQACSMAAFSSASFSSFFFSPYWTDKGQRNGSGGMSQYQKSTNPY